MIKVDSYYAMGHSHLYVQDYALASTEGVSHIIVADGCSSSRYADVGARLLAHAAHQYVLDQMSEVNHVPEVMTLANHVAWQTHSVAQWMGLENETIDATLSLVFVKDETVHAYMLGDGVIAVWDRDNNKQVIEVNYSHNAPFYPTYLTDASRLANYQEFSREHNRTLSINNVQLQSAPADAYFYQSWPRREIASILLGSDGVQSFIDQSLQSNLAAEVVLQELNGFLNTNDAFLKRRMKRALREWSKQGIIHSDDVAIAAMVMNHEEGAS